MTDIKNNCLRHIPTNDSQANIVLDPKGDDLSGAAENEPLRISRQVCVFDPFGMFDANPSSHPTSLDDHPLVRDY